MMCKCDLCGQSFPLKIQLVVHKRVKHPDQDAPLKDSQGTQIELPLQENSNQTSRIIVHKSAEECLLNLDPALEPEDTSDVESTDDKVKYKLKSTFQPDIALKAGTRINEKSIDEVMEMDHSTSESKGSSGASLSSAMLFAKLIYDYKRPKKAVLEPVEPSRCQDSTNQSLAMQSCPSVTPEELIDSEETTNGRESQPLKNELLWKSSRIRSLSDADNVKNSVSAAISEFACISCSKVMSSQKNLILHLRSYHAGSADLRKFTIRKQNILQGKPSILKKYPCKKCDKNFSQFKKLWKHRLNVCGLVSKYKYSKCSLKLRQSSRFRRQETVQTNGKVRKSKYQDDFRFYHSKVREEVEKPELSMKTTQFKCRVPGCSESYSDVILLHDHVKNFHRVFMCIYCESVLLTQSQLEIHIQKRHPKETEHNSEKNDNIQETHSCDFCGMHFSAEVGPGSLKEHIFQMHSSESLNNEEFKAGRTMIDSLDTSVSESELRRTKLIKPMTCTACNKVFKQLRSYILHKRDHKLQDSAIILPKKSKPETAEIQRKTSTSSIPSSPSPTSSSQVSVTRPKRPCASIGSFQPVEKAARLKSVHVGEDELKCSECEVVFHTNRMLRIHLERDSCKKKLYAYVCALCSQGFSREASLKNHIKSQHEDIANTDDNSSSSSTVNMNRQPTETEKQRQCTICAKIFSSLKVLNSHIATFHPTDDIAPNRISLKSSRVVQTSSTTVVGNNWTISKDTDRVSPKYGLHRNLEADFVKKPQAVAVISPQHPRIQGDQRLKCNDCGECFQSNNELVQHLLWHNENKGTTIPRGLKKVGVVCPPESTEVLIKCVICGGGFHKRGDMIAHVKIRHTRKGVYACMECNKRFQRALDLVDHSIIHDKEFMRRNSREFIDNEDEESEVEEEEDGEDDYPKEEEEQIQFSNSKLGRGVSKKVPSSTNQSVIRCTKCSQSFTNNTDFRLHWHSHSVGDQGKNYICTTCRESFSEVEELNRHRQAKHPETKVFICDFPNCGIPFVHQLGLKRHMKDHHGQRPAKRVK